MEKLSVFSYQYSVRGTSYDRLLITDNRLLRPEVAL
jgi:hypothetical protein